MDLTRHFDENLRNSKELASIAEAKGISLEVEVGTIGGEEDGLIGNGEVAKPEEIAQLAALNPAMIAAGIGNIHGPYPESWDHWRLMQFCNFWSCW